MIAEETKKRVLDLCNKPVGLGGWLGMPFHGDDTCVKFAVMVYNALGIEADDNGLKEARNFDRVENPQFGDIVVFRENSVFPGGEFHIGVMLDNSWAIQCTPASNGVGKISVDRYPWNLALKGFYRHKQCS